MTVPAAIRELEKLKWLRNWMADNCVWVYIQIVSDVRHHEGILVSAPKALTFFGIFLIALFTYIDKKR